MEWQLADDGSFALAAGGLRLERCYPAFDLTGIRPTRVEVAAKRITYSLAGGAGLVLEFGVGEGKATLDTTFIGAGRMPWRFSPLRGVAKGASRVFRLGLGFSGPGGLVDIAPAAGLFSHESYLATALCGADSAVAFGALRHDVFLQNTIIANQQARRGLTNRHVEIADVVVDVGFSTEGIAAADELKLPTLVFRADASSFDALQTLARDIAAEMHCRMKLPSRYHWCSWYEKGCNFSLDDLRAMLAGLKAMPDSPALQAIQIDDGYCPSPGDWLTPSALWPGGLPAAFDEIRKAGHAAGVWVAPFMVGSLSKLYREHPDWIIRDHCGAPVVEWKKYDASGIPSHIDPEHYALDASHPGVQEYIRHVFRQLRAWGATMYKTDFMDWGLRDSTSFKRHNPSETSVQSFRKVLQIIREEIGEDSYWLACISPYAPFLGYADGMRIANDIGPSWGEGSQGNMIQESLATQFFNNILWQNDTDAILLRDYHNDLTDTQVWTLALFQGFIGSAVNFSDAPHRLPAEREALLRFLRPPERVTCAEIWRWENDAPVKTLYRRHGENVAVLVVNSSRSAQLEVIEIAGLTGRPSTQAFTWSPAGASPVGELSSLVIRLAPYESQLYYLSGSGRPPKKGMCITGREGA